MGIELGDLQQIKEIVNDHKDGICINEISDRVNLHRNTVSKYLSILHLKGNVDIITSGSSKKYYPSKRISETTVKNFFFNPYIIVNSGLNIHYANESFYKITGSNQKQIIGFNLDSVQIPLFNDPNLKNQYKRTINGEIFTRHISTKIKGTDYYLYVRLIPTIFEDRTKGITIVLIDNTKFKEHITPIKTGDCHYRNILENQTEYVCRLLPDMTITFANKAFCGYIHKKEDEATGLKFNPVIVDENTVLEEIFDEISPEKPTKKITLKSLNYEGTVRHIEWNIKGIFDINNILTEYQSTGRDITELKNAEEKLEVYKNNLEELIKKRTEELQAVNKKLFHEILKQRDTEEHLNELIKEIRTVKYELSENETKLNFIMKAADLGTCDINYKKGTISLNKNALVIIGYSAKDFSKNLKDWDLMIHPEDYSSVMKKRKCFIDGDIPHVIIEFRILCGKGWWKWISYTNTTTIRDNMATLVSATGILQDIDRRKNIEKNIEIQKDIGLRLSESSGKSEAISYCLDSLLSILDMEFGIYYEKYPDSGDFALSESRNVDETTNPFCLQYNQHSHFSSIADSGTTIISGHKEVECITLRHELKDEIKSAIMIPVKNNRADYGCYLIYSYKRTDIPEYSINATESVITNLINTIKKIDAQKRLKKSNKYHRGLIEICPDALVLISPAGKINDVNSACEEITGYIREELIGNDFSDYFSDPERASHGYKTAYKNGSLIDYRLEIKHKNGSLIKVSYNVSVYRNDDGTITGIFAVARKI
ncbi:PAS domain S-box protein [Methanoplanus limicola]|uniref:histidine kinase n=1 Tax=Methanoplanus limicola DSM 2279 TaxID=937775 RepID=H1YYQ4_9EURY|nr:PAS domain S-box protein [Methanoplanus limicola]EHQ36037.1 PAS sensor protein [Methanoplanus limicola DSM 2279]